MPDILRRLILTTGAHCVPSALLRGAQWGGADGVNYGDDGGGGDGGSPSAASPTLLTPVRPSFRGNREPVSSSSPQHFLQTRCRSEGGSLRVRAETSHPRAAADDDSEEDTANDENSPPPPPPPHLLTGGVEDYPATAAAGLGGDDTAAAAGKMIRFPLSPPPAPHLREADGGGGDAQSRAPLLLPSHPSKRDRLCVVLDIDETLVCAYNANAVPEHLRGPLVVHRHRTFNLQCNGGDTLSLYADKPAGPGIAEVAAEGGGVAITVFERPGLARFLLELATFAEVVVFTAGMEGYAKPLTDAIDPHGAIGGRLYRDACVCTSHRDHVKDLSRLGRDLRRTVLVDNNPFSFLLQPHNGVPVASFTGDPDDVELERSLLPLLRALAAEAAAGADVRHLLARRFRMAEWFQTRGIDLAAVEAGWGLPGEARAEPRRRVEGATRGQDARRPMFAD